MPCYEPPGTAEEKAVFWANYEQRRFGDDLGRAYSAVDKVWMFDGMPFWLPLWQKPVAPEHGAELKSRKRSDEYRDCPFGS